MQIIELATKLQSVGLTDKQARVYVAALFLGSASAQKIAQQAEVNRATTYVILDELAGMGMVSQSTEGKKTVFVAEPPEALERYLEGQKTSIEAKKSELKSLMPSLKQQEHGGSSDAPEVRFFRGKEGAVAIDGYLRRKARTGSSVYALSDYNEVVKLFPDALKANPTKRLKKKISSKMFYYSTIGDLNTDKSLMRETSKLDTPISADIALYEEGVAIGTYGEHDSISVIIESKEIAAALRQLFELAWNNQKRQ